MSLALIPSRPERKRLMPSTRLSTTSATLSCEKVEPLGPLGLCAKETPKQNALEQNQNEKLLQVLPAFEPDVEEVCFVALQV